MEKVTNRCLHFTTSLILYKQKLSTPILTNSYLELTRRKEVVMGIICFIKK